MTIERAHGTIESDNGTIERAEGTIARAQVNITNTHWTIERAQVGVERGRGGWRGDPTDGGGGEGGERCPRIAFSQTPKSGTRGRAQRAETVMKPTIGERVVRNKIERFQEACVVTN